MKTKAQEQRDDRQAKEREEKTLMDLARRKSLDALLRIVALAEDEKPKDWDVIMRDKDGDVLPWRPLRIRDVKSYLLAQQMIIERAYGKAAQAVNLGDEKGGPLQISVNIVRSKPREEAE